MELRFVFSIQFPNFEMQTFKRTRGTMMCNTFIVAFGFLFSVQGIYLPGKPIDKLKSKLPSIITTQNGPQMQASEYLQPPEMPLIGGPESLPDFLKFPRAPKPAETQLLDGDMPVLNAGDSHNDVTNLEDQLQVFYQNLEPQIPEIPQNSNPPEFEISSQEMLPRIGNAQISESSGNAKKNPLLLPASAASLPKIQIVPAILEGGVEDFLEEAKEEIQGCTEGFIPNAKFFEEYEDPKRPCYKQVCYPDKKSGYFWQERFQSDKCCKHGEHEIIYGSELVLGNDDTCRNTVVQCDQPTDEDSPLVPIVIVGEASCCVFNDMILEPNQSKTDFQSCGIAKCLLTPENGPEIIHEVLYPNGCCNIDENLVEEDGIFETAKGTFLCHNGEPVKIVTEDSVMSAYEDLMGGSPISSGHDGDYCSTCHTDFSHQGEFQDMVQLVNDFISHESIKKIHFVLMGNEAAHKRTTAALASQFKESDAQFFLAYYSFHEDGSASSFYDWNHQCSTDKCQLVNAILNSNDDFEDELPDSSGYAGFANAADLGIATSMQSMEKLCPSNPDSNHAEHLFVFLTPPGQTEIIEFPASVVEKYFSFGCKLILFTFNEPYYRAAMPFASKNENGRIMAFLVEMDQLAEISTCLGKCSCPIVETEDYIDACVATFQYRSNLNSQIEKKDTDCAEDNFFPLQMDDTLEKFSQDEGLPTKKDDSTLDRLKLCLEQQFPGNVNVAKFKLCMKELLKN